MARGRITQDQLLEIAYTIASEEGPCALNVRRVSKDANIALGTLYNYYPSIDALVLATSKVFFERNLRDKICKPEENETFLEFCKRIYPALNQAFSAYNTHWLQVLHSLKEPIRDQSREQQNEILRHAAQALAGLLMRDVHRGICQIPEGFTSQDIGYFTITSLLDCISHQNQPDVLFALLHKTLYV